MKVTGLKVKGTWREVADSARTTIGLEEGTKEPTSKWKLRILKSEHSPIRNLIFRWKWLDLPYFVSVHICRHKFGIEHYVKSQRSDRTGIKRDELPQGALVTHEVVANTQAVIEISRKRLCRQASPETQGAWRAVVKEIAKVQPEVAVCCVPSCIRHGHCYEFSPCGYSKTEAYKKALEEYRTTFSLDSNVCV